MAKTEVAGRPPLPRHKGLPAGKKKRETEKWRGGERGQLMEKGDRGDVKEGEAE